MYNVLEWSDAQDGYVPAKDEKGKTYSYPTFNEAADKAYELRLATGNMYSVSFTRSRRKVKRP